jgi:hypothetical protein
MIDLAAKNCQSSAAFLFIVRVYYTARRTCHREALMCVCARVLVAAAIAMLAMTSCQSREEKERELTEECKKEDPCKKQGLCTGTCNPEPCHCVVATNADCAQAIACGASGQCTAKDGKCVVATNDDCAKGAACKASGFCTAKDGICVVGTDADCSQSELCKNLHKCSAKNSACIDASFSPALLNPALTNEQAPEKFKVKFTTAKGTSWSRSRRLGRLSAQSASTTS